MYSAVPKTGSTLIHWALSVLGEKYNNFKVVGFRSMPMYEDTFIGHIKHDYFYSECDCGSHHLEWLDIFDLKMMMKSGLEFLF